ncbi:MAG: N-formylglutamate amidohydrolase [Sphingosinicella sp.]|uniref:N-formylglutamate amidohydrolase n=1 Tax=Sphingosinicella sp. TaxID=1917971 RepID=UPI0040377845
MTEPPSDAPSADAPADVPFVRIGPARPESPVVLSVPHAGRAYSPALLAAARLHRSVLESLEDRLVDRLVWRATDAGATAFVALTPRAEIDLNREERELDAALIDPPPPATRIVQSLRTRGGIGLIPARIAGAGAIWKARIPQAELDRRIASVHRPYHAALAAALAAARDRFGAALLLDCHSMPPRPPPDGGRDGIAVFGDRHGTSCAPELIDAAVAAARGLGYRIGVNAPYAGGYIVGRHGRPETGVHALQLELCRSAYLDVELRNPGPGFADACRLIEAVVAALEARLLGEAQAIAAE